MVFIAVLVHSMVYRLSTAEMVFFHRRQMTAPFLSLRARAISGMPHFQTNQNTSKYNVIGCI